MVGLVETYLRVLAGAEGSSRVSKRFLNPLCDRVRAPEHAPGNPLCVLKRRHALPEIVERGPVVHVERLRVKPPTLDQFREAVKTLEETERTARRVFGGAHPITEDIEATLRHARAALRVRAQETPGA